MVSAPILFFLSNNQGEKMKKIFIVILLFSIFSSCKKNFEPKDFVYKDILIIKNGSKLIQGKEYEIIWNTKGLNSNKFFTDIVFHFEKEGTYQYKVIKLREKDSTHYSGIIHIPFNASEIWIDLSTSYSTLSCPYSVRLPVFRDENTPEYGANGVLLMNSDKNNYLNFFYSERKLYPQNYSIFVQRWMYELNKNIFVKDSILAQLKELEKHPNSPEVQIIRLIGNSIVMNYSYHTEILEDLANRLKFTPVLNNIEVSSTLSQMLPKNFEKDSLNIKKLIENSIRYNPYSHFAKCIINHGTIFDKRIVNPKTALLFLNKLIQKDSSYELLLRKTFLLSIHFRTDSVDELNKLFWKLKKAYDDYLVDDETYFKLQDCGHSFFISNGYYPNIIRDLAFTTKNYDLYIETLKEMAPKIYGNLFAKGLYYYALGEIYEKINQVDSALKYYYYAQYSLAAPTRFYKKFMDLTKGKMPKDYKAITKILYRKYGSPLIKISGNLPTIEFTNGEKVILDNTKDPKMFIFFSTNCGICEVIFKELSKVRNYLTKKKVKMYFISNEPTKQLENLWIYDYFGTKVVANTREIKNFLGIGDEVPQVLLVNSNNYIVNWINGYYEGNINWEKAISDLN